MTPVSVDYDSSDHPPGILIADGRPIVRAGLRSALTTGSSAIILGEAGDVASTIARTIDDHPDIVIIDIALACAAGLHALIRLAKLANPPKIIVCHVPEDAFTIRRLAEIGVRGFVARDAGQRDLVDAIAAVRGTGCYISSTLTNVFFRSSSPVPESARKLGLTQRETDVLQLLCDGYSNKAIANRLELSVRTVESHRLNLRKKTGASSLQDLVRLSRSIGLDRIASQPLSDLPLL